MYLLSVLSLAVLQGCLIAGPILPYEKYYEDLLGIDKANVTARQLEGFMVRIGDEAVMTCDMDDALGSCMKWIRNDRPFDEIQTLKSYGCNQDEHTEHDSRKTFITKEDGAKVKMTFRFKGMTDEDKGIYYCFQMRKTQPYYMWKTFVIHD